MMALDGNGRHEDVWLLLPWLANGRLSTEEREMAEEHVRQCAACEKELALQLRMCDAFAQPDRVVHAPGASFRKLMDRIESDSAQNVDTSEVVPAQPSPEPSLIHRLSHVSLWRPPGLAWAASFLLLFGMTGILINQWASKVYVTHTDSSIVSPNVLHIAVDRSLPIGQVDDLLRSGGARLVEGPDSTGYLGVTPVGIVEGQTPTGSANKQLRSLSARLRADRRVLWVQPLADEGTPAGPDAQER
jgi:hypothetical protein